MQSGSDLRMLYLLFHEAKTLLLRRHKLFVQSGENVQDEIVEINTRLKEIKVDVEKNSRSRKPRQRDLGLNYESMCLQFRRSSKKRSNCCRGLCRGGGTIPYGQADLLLFGKVRQCGKAW